MINGYGLCLNEWLEDENIKTELRLLIKISSLTAEKGFCYASNSFFAEYFKTSEVTISKQIKKLESLNYIEIEYERRGAEVLKRFVRLKKTLTDDYQKLKPTIKENFKDNNTSINNTSINKEKDKKEILFSQLIKQYDHYDIYENIALDFIAYRKQIKKPLKTILPIKQFMDSLIELSKLGYSFDYCIEQMKSNEWQTVKKDYIHKPKPQQKSRAESNRDFIREHYGMNEDNIIDTEII